VPYDRCNLNTSKPTCGHPKHQLTALFLTLHTTKRSLCIAGLRRGGWVAHQGWTAMHETLWARVGARGLYRDHRRGSWATRPAGAHPAAQGTGWAPSRRWEDENSIRGIIHVSGVAQGRALVGTSANKIWTRFEKIGTSLLLMFPDREYRPLYPGATPHCMDTILDGPILPRSKHTNNTNARTPCAAASNRRSTNRLASPHRHASRRCCAALALSVVGESRNTRTPHCMAVGSGSTGSTGSPSGGVAVPQIRPEKSSQ
jgi:hypothetical protein